MSCTNVWHKNITRFFTNLILLWSLWKKCLFHLFFGGGAFTVGGVLKSFSLLGGRKWKLRCELAWRRYPYENRRPCSPPNNISPRVHSQSPLPRPLLISPTPARPWSRRRRGWRRERRWRWAAKKKDCEDRGTRRPCFGRLRRRPRKSTWSIIRWCRRRTTLSRWESRWTRF